jgi:hypothetical protein
MFMKRRLACSFCGKSAAEVSKLVAGPKVYICDECVAIASRIMSDPATPPRPAQLAPGIWRRIGAWLRRPAEDRDATRAQDPVRGMSGA